LAAIQSGWSSKRKRPRSAVRFASFAAFPTSTAPPPY
jgi:hypothetical protein